MGTYTCYWCSSSHFVSEFPKGKRKVIWESIGEKSPVWALDILQEILRVEFFSVCLKDSHRSGCLTSYTHGQPWSKPCFDMDVGSNPAAANNIRLKKNHSYFCIRTCLSLRVLLLEVCTPRGFRGNVLLYPSCLSTELSRQKGSRYIKMQSQG